MQNNIKNFNDVSSHIKLRKKEWIEYCVEFLGSKKYLWISTIGLVLYVLFNVFSPHSFDKPPFLGLNLFLSCYAFYTFNLVGILDRTRSNDAKQIEELYYNYEQELYASTNSRIDELETKVSELHNKMDFMIDMLKKS